MVLLIHHLHVSQSERIPWVCEELGIEYDLKTYRRAPILAPPEYKALHPMGAAPVIEDGDLILAESCACIEYICHKYGNGKLFLPRTHPDYANFLYWWHWADGTFQPALLRALGSGQTQNGTESIAMKIAIEKFHNSLDALNLRFGDNKWLSGGDFTVADIMVVFSLTTIRHFFPYSLKEYPNIVEYLGRISQRAAYQSAMKKCDPGMQLILESDPPAKAS